MNSNFQSLLVGPKQVYTCSPVPIWQNTAGYTQFTKLDARQGDYNSYPFAPFHPRDVSVAMGYKK